MDEISLLRRCFKKDTFAWNEFIDRYSKLIYNYIYKVFKSKGYIYSNDEVDELFQEFFLSLLKDNFRKLKRFKAKATLATYLRVLCINFILDYLRKVNNKKYITFSSSEKLPYSDDLSIEDTLSDDRYILKNELTKNENITILKDCIKFLDIDDKYFLEMHIYRGINLEALRKTFGLSRACIDMRKHRIIEKLKKCFREKGFDI